jgi:biotin carboxyl carrier protein
VATTGTVTEIHVADGEPVEFDQPLVSVRVSD